MEIKIKRANLRGSGIIHAICL
jgi:hypothetical protein